MRGALPPHDGGRALDQRLHPPDALGAGLRGRRNRGPVGTPAPRPRPPALRAGGGEGRTPPPEDPRGLGTGSPRPARATAALTACRRRARGLRASRVCPPRADAPPRRVPRVRGTRPPHTAGPPPLVEELPPGAPGGQQATAQRAPVIRRVSVNPRTLAAELRRARSGGVALRSATAGRARAPWCEPCRALDAAFARESNRALLAGWWLVRGGRGRAAARGRAGALGPHRPCARPSRPFRPARGLAPGSGASHR